MVGSFCVADNTTNDPVRLGNHSVAMTAFHADWTTTQSGAASGGSGQWRRRPGTAAASGKTSQTAASGGRTVKYVWGERERWPEHWPHTRVFQKPLLSWNLNNIWELGIGLSDPPARLRRLAEFIPWNRFLGSKTFKNTVSGKVSTGAVQVDTGHGDSMKRRRHYGRDSSTCCKHLLEITMLKKAY
jgi:hypothetical protein